MYFVDEVIITVKSGKGGNGLIAWRREKNAPFGGPCGGDGGNGGNIFFVVDKNVNSLLFFKLHRNIKACNGEHGKYKNQSGSNGKDIILKVPIGTQIFDYNTGKLLMDMNIEKYRFLACEGGKGGSGNSKFVSATRRTPCLAQNGYCGKEFNLYLVLKMIADVGLLGFPNVGKSSLLSVLSRAKPKIANYPFTTLIPQLGVIPVDDDNSLVMADIPGICYNASKGTGLGLRFLKHLDRVKVLCHVMELNGLEELKYDILIHKYKIIRQELKNFSLKLWRLPEIVVLNKIDLLNNELACFIIKIFKCYLKKYDKKLFKISVFKRHGLSSLINALHKTVCKYNRM